MRLAHERPRRAVIHTGAKDRQGGYVLVMFAMLLIPLLLFVGLSVDVGSWYNRAAEIQKASDAAALAGVVWLPDETTACSVAVETARKNGFDVNDPNIDVTCSKSPTVANRLKVGIRDNRVGSFFYSNLGGGDLDMKRNAYAEYITPVPLGSPRNFFGLGTLDGTGYNKEYLYQSINPYCTSKANGDRHQTPFGNGPSGSTTISTTQCSASPTDPDYRATGYELYVDAPAGRTSPIEFLIYDGRYNEDAYTYDLGTSTCTITGYNYVWPTPPVWTGPSTSSTSTLTINGPKQYQTSDRRGNWSGTQTLDPGQSFSNRRDRLRYQDPISYTPIETCVPDTGSEVAIDDERNSNEETYTMSVFASDDTPLNDTDNPLVCRRTFAHDDPFDGTDFLGTRRWNKMQVGTAFSSSYDTNLCTIPVGSQYDGRYIVRFRNNGAIGNRADGSNQWGIVARYANATGTGLCDGRSDGLCPRVYGKDAISVRAAATTTQASFFLAEIPATHAGKKLKIELWDPGEGGNYIQILKPVAGSDPDGTWAPTAFDWKASGAGSANNVTSVSVINSVFNSRLLEITVDLTGYAPPSDNNWWKIYYNFNSGTAVTDRTTWSARILGDPVHLVEE
ncbi:MAG: Tad domain-containing protein [Actinobacteria bacterium]|nr:Tad domain-containing protein [Actinomycetota bacterium]